MDCEKVVRFEDGGFWWIKRGLDDMNRIVSYQKIGEERERRLVQRYEFCGTWMLGSQIGVDNNVVFFMIVLICCLNNMVDSD